ncbi:hypothetical protein BD770DRAFT_412698 [Pilaira anomala]|nr:hypothetical protein BD770DRAFT_412698 [Pilaira anomala]
MMEASNVYSEYKLDVPTRVRDYTSYLDWTLNLKDIPEEEVKRYCLFLKNKIPSKSKLKADASKPSKKRRININCTQLIIGDNIVNPTNINHNYNTTKEEEDGKEEEGDEKEEDKKEEEGGDEKEERAKKVMQPSFWKDWERFLINSENFHPFSPQNTITLSDADKNLREEYTSAVKGTSLCTDDNETITYDFLENIFRAMVAAFVADTLPWTKAGFRSGEASLQSMSGQLKNYFPFYDEESHIYLADGLFNKLYGLKELEILLLETSGCFGSTDQSKHSFDHHKGVFGATSMLKQIADTFYKPFHNGPFPSSCETEFISDKQLEISKSDYHHQCSGKDVVAPGFLKISNNMEIWSAEKTYCVYNRRLSEATGVWCLFSKERSHSEQKLINSYFQDTKDLRDSNNHLVRVVYEQ